MESGQEDGRGLLVAGRNAAPLLEAVDAPLDGVALLVGITVEGRWPAALAAASQPVVPLVRRDWDHRPDTAFAVGLSLLRQIPDAGFAATVR